MNKRLIILSLFVGLIGSAFAQKQIAQYEYWFDNNDVAKTAISITPVASYALNTSIPTTGLPAGLHSFQIRFKQTAGLWSSTSTQFFVKVPNTSAGQNQVTQYEYWFDTNYSSKTIQPVSNQTNVSLSTSVSTAQLPVGLHSFQLRFKDNTGTWSSTTTRFFVKQPSSSTENTKISKYEYWFDDNYAGKTAQTITSQSDVSLVTSIAPGKLPVGLHSFQMRFQSASGKWSSTTTQFFVKQPASTTEDTKISNYEYWFDNNYAGKTAQSITSQSDVSLVTSIATGKLPAGLHSFQMRFQSVSGKWSSTTTQFFVKPNDAGIGNNKIVAYEYWFNDSINKRTNVKIDPIDPLELRNKIVPVNSLKTQITKDAYQMVKDADGNYKFATVNRFYIHFKDINGLWSSVTDTTFASIIDNVDLSPFITNPDANDGSKGWTTSGTISTFVQNTAHWTGTTNPYFNLGSTTKTGWTASMTQTITGLPAGTYTLNATGRSAIDTKMMLTVAGTSVDFPANGAVGGEIWEDALAGSVEKKCNNGTGFGWNRRGITFTTDGTPVVILVSGSTTKSNQWCNIDNFTLGLDNSSTLNVSLPDSASAVQYKGCTLQLINKTSGSKIALTTTGKQTYTFSGLVASNYYHVDLTTAKGTLIGSIDSIKLNRGNNAVKFSALKAIVPVVLQVLTPAKKNVTNDVAIQWYDEVKQFLLQNDTLPDMTVGTVIYYSVGLNNELGLQFKQPVQQKYTVVAGANIIVYTLQAMDSVTITGTLKDERGNALSDGLVAIKQLLNGKYEKNFSAHTDNTGKYSITVLNDSSIISYSYSGYITQTRTYSNFNGSTNLGTTSLQPITGLTVNVNFNYTKSVAAGETAVPENYYSNYVNVSYQAYNLTTGKAISKLNVQYPDLIIQDSTSVSDQIRITASSKTSEFNPVSSVIVVSKNYKDTVTFNLKELGVIKATYSASSNSSNVGVLYNAQGQLVKKDTYSGGTITFSSLPDGNYSLVSIAGSTFYSAVSNLADLSSSGLTEGTDYVRNNMQVQSGVISTVGITSIPALNETMFYYTGTNTSFSVNKTSVTSGNYVTLRAKLDFKNQYTGNVSNISLIVDIPDGCSFVKNSVMVGSGVSAYVQEGSRVTIPLNSNYTDPIRFCIIPTVGGKYYPTAFVKFDSNKKTITQPIGSASFTAEDMSIVVPEQTAKKIIPVSGTAPAYSTVSIYDGTTEIGQTTAYATGMWMISCELFEAYNLTTHNISAHIQTPAGITILTETKKVEYNISMIEVKTVTMINTAHGPESLNLKEYNTVFDFQHPNATMPPYWYWPSYPDFTFKIDFTNNDTAYVSNVTLYVKTSSNDIVPLAASYDKTKDIWVATKKFTSNSLPVNLSVDYKANSEALLDGEYMSKSYDIGNDWIIEFKSKSDLYSSMDSLIDIELKKEIIDKNKIDSLYKVFEEINSIYSIYELKSEFNKENYLLTLNSFSEIDYKSYITSFIDEVSLLITNRDSAIIKEFSKINSYNYSDVDGNNGVISINSTNGYAESELESLGFLKIQTTKNTYLYIKNTENENIVIDFDKNICLKNNWNKTVFKSTRLNKMNNSDEFYDIYDKILKTYDALDKSINLSKKIITQLMMRVDSHTKEIIKKINENKELLDWQRNNTDFVINPQDIKNTQIKRKELLKELGECEKSLILYKNILNGITSIASIVLDRQALINDFDEWNSIISGIELSDCPDAESLLIKAKGYRLKAAIGYFSILIGDCGSLGETLACILGAPETLGTSLSGVPIGLSLLAISWAASNRLTWEDERWKFEIRIAIPTLKCDNNPKPNPDSNNNNSGNGGGTSGNSGSGNSNGAMDPSGYVFEAISKNRMEGVTTTIYRKTVEEDMYGDKHDVITKWDAASFLQVNPLITDENGVYAWDVPDGLWQVKYEKTGYETAYSSWLPVPPPQLDINVGMKHTIPPTAKKVRGYEEGINIQFDKYMRPATMTNKQIILVKNGVNVTGSVRMLNEEEGYAADTAKYVSKVRFVPDQIFTEGDKVTVTVKSAVESYAGMNMASDYTQVVEIEKEVKAIISDSLAEMNTHTNRAITVSVLPAAAAKGKTIMANSASFSIVSLSSTQAVLDNNGKATFNVNGDLPGGTTVQFSISDVDDLSAVTKVNVLEATQVFAPTASIASGTTVPKDTTVTLSSVTPGATIYYTTDGTLPSDVYSTRQIYGTPISISNSVTIKAVATKTGFVDSDITQFTYKVNSVNTSDSVNSVVASVASGSTVLKNSTVSLTCPTAGATIYYTNDGTSPSNEGGTRQVYINPILIPKSTTILSKAIKAGLYDSKISQFTYKVDTVKTVSASVVSGATVAKNSTITLLCPTSGATIYYTTDGTSPDSEGGSRQLYANPISIPKSMTIYSKATKNGLYDSEITQFTYKVDTLNNIETVKTVTASIASGTTVLKNSTVTLACPTSGATIYYTKDGTLPNEGSTRQVYTNPILIPKSMTVISKAMKEGLYDSEISQFAYKVDTVKVVSASVATGSTVLKNSTVTLTCPTSGATIYYTTDGTLPNEGGTRQVYTNPILIPKSMTVISKAMKDGLYDSKISQFAYKVDTVKTVTTSVASGSTVAKNSTVMLNCSTSGAIIYYTTDGTSPNEGGTRQVYSNPILIPKSMTIISKATKDGLYDSEITQFTYKVDTVKAIMSSVISGSTVQQNSTVSLSCATSGATIYFTTDGISPGIESGTRQVYINPIKITKSMTILAIGAKEGFNNSEVANFVYKVDELNVLISKKWNDVLVCNNTGKLFSSYQWYKNDAVLSGETKQYYQETGGLNGSYFVKVMTIDGKSGVSNTISVNASAKSIKVYPNPTEDNQSFRLEIEVTEMDIKDALLSIVSLNGQVLYKNNNLQFLMQMTGLPKGCYIIHVRLSNGEQLNEKLIVN